MFIRKKVFLNTEILRALKLEIYSKRLKQEIINKKTTWAKLAEQTNMIYREPQDMSVLNALRKKKYGFSKITPDKYYRKVNKLKEFLDSGSLWEMDGNKKMSIALHLKCWEFSEGHRYGKSGVGFEMTGRVDVRYLFPIKDIREIAVGEGWLEYDQKYRKYVLTGEGHRLEKVVTVLRLAKERRVTKDAIVTAQSRSGFHGGYETIR